MEKTYTYVAKGTVEITELVYEYGEEDPIEIIDVTLNELNEDEFSTLEQVLDAEEDLTEYIPHGSSIYGVVKTIRIGIDKEGSVTEIDTTELLTKQQEEALVRYLNGQFSDGWGEGFHQHPFYEGDKVLIAGFESVHSLTQKTNA